MLGSSVFGCYIFEQTLFNIDNSIMTHNVIINITECRIIHVHLCRCLSVRHRSWPCLRLYPCPALFILRPYLEVLLSHDPRTGRLVDRIHCNIVNILLCWILCCIRYINLQCQHVCKMKILKTSWHIFC